MDPRRASPRLALTSLLGNLAFIASWAVVLTRPAGWQVVGPLLLVAFLALRVGGMWLYVSRYPDETGRSRRAALFTTALALVATGLWVLTLLRGPRPL